jgi:hypothetical protein
MTLSARCPLPLRRNAAADDRQVSLDPAKTDAGADLAIEMSKAATEQGTERAARGERPTVPAVPGAPGLTCRGQSRRPEPTSRRCQCRRLHAGCWPVRIRCADAATMSVRERFLLVFRRTRYYCAFCIPPGAMIQRPAVPLHPTTHRPRRSLLTRHPAVRS